MKRILKILIIFVLGIMILSINVQATSSMSMQTAKNFASQGQTSLINYQSMYYVVNTIYGIAMAIAIAIALVKGALLAFRIITGSLDERVDAKKMILDYVFLVIILAIAPTILQLIMRMLKSKF